MRREGETVVLVALDVLQDGSDEELLAWALEVLGLAGGEALLAIGFSPERYQHMSTSTSRKRLPRSMSITWGDLGRYGLFGKKGVVHSFGSASSSASSLKRVSASSSDHITAWVSSTQLRCS